MSRLRSRQDSSDQSDVTSDRMPIPPDKAGVLIVDKLQLRRATMAKVLVDWAGKENVTISSTSLRELRTVMSANPLYRLIIYNIGAQSLNDQEIRDTVAELSSLFHNAQLVILSETDNPEEVCAAFRVGAAGHIPANCNLTIFLNALALILGGGTYYPPSVLRTTEVKQAMQTTVQYKIRVGSGRESEQSRAEPEIIPPNTSVAPDFLTSRQSEVLDLLCEGLPNKVIARQLGTSEATIKVHVRQIMRKFGVSNRTQVAVARQKLSH